MSKRESWLIQQLDSGRLTPEVMAEYEAELDRIADQITKGQKANQEHAAREAARRAEICAKLEADDQDFIFVLGQEEFGADYELIIEGIEFVVYSKVAQDFQNSRRPHVTLALAEADLRYLYRNRLYDRYVRSGEIEALKKLVG